MSRSERSLFVRYFKAWNLLDTMTQIERSINIDAPLDTVFAFVSDIRNHRLVVPPKTDERLLDAGDFPFQVGTVVRLSARYGWFRWTLSSRIVAHEPPSSLRSDTAYFRDEQIRGPFAVWQHDHGFAALEHGGTRLTDRFTYSAPLGPLGKLAERVWLNGEVLHLLEHMQDAQKQIIEAACQSDAALH